MLVVQQMSIYRYSCVKQFVQVWVLLLVFLSLSGNQEMAMDCATLTRHSVAYLLAKLDSYQKHPVYTAHTVSINAKYKYKSINPGF